MNNALVVRCSVPLDVAVLSVLLDDRGDTIARFGGDDGGALRDGNALLGLILGLIARCVRRIG